MARMPGGFSPPTHDLAWNAFAKEVIEWCSGYSNVVLHEGAEKSLRNRLKSLEVSGFKPSCGIGKFLDELESMLTYMMNVIPNIVMSDKKDTRYRQVVDQFYEAHPEKFLELWLDLRGPGGFAYDTEEIKPAPPRKDLLFFKNYQNK